MRKRIAAALAALVLCLGLGLASAPAAQAGTLCDTTNICGRVVNSSQSNARVSITNSVPAKSVWTLAPGQGSSQYIKDTDMFRIPSGCKGKSTAGISYSAGVWHKIHDAAYVTVIITC